MTTDVPYEDFGGAGRWLHLAHANGYPPNSYRALAGHLAQSHRVVSMEQRPLWPSSDPQDFDSWHPIGDDLLAFLEQHGIERLVGVGHSLGAVATMYAAVNCPELFAAVILIEPVFFPPATLDQLRQNPETALRTPLIKRTNRRRNSWPNREAAFARFREKRVFSRLSDEALWDYVNSAVVAGPDDTARLRYPREWEARIYATPPTDVWEKVAQLRPPTLAVRAAHSDTLDSAAWAHWQQRQPAAHFVEAPGSDHLLPMSHPAQLAGIILTFLQETQAI
jgi:pimeloyl-ACP methyl ester carboxylesterase